jgi:hypothetical protein
LLGNLVSGELVVNITGGRARPCVCGRVVNRRLVQPVTDRQREVFDVSQQGGGLLLLQVERAGRSQTLKVVRQ